MQGNHIEKNYVIPSMQGNHRGYGERKANICIMKWLVAKQSSYRFFFFIVGLQITHTPK